MEEGWSSSELIRNYAQYSIRRIPRICELNRRREIPTKLELEALKRCAKVTVRVNFLDNTYIMLQTDSWMTVGDANTLIAKRLGIKNSSPYALFEVSSDSEERVLESDERVLDLVSSWQRLFDKEKEGKMKQHIKFSFVYKVSATVVVVAAAAAARHILFSGNKKYANKAAKK